MIVTSCENFVELETPNYSMITENVFADDETADAAMTGIYNQLYRPSTFFSNGYESSVTILAGISADLIRPRAASHPTYNPFWQNSISTIDTPDADANLDLWSSAYNIIYLANSVIEGVEKSTQLSSPVRNRLIGQALFVRAFTNFYLTQLYGDVPLLLTTDYRINSNASRSSSDEVITQIIKDLDRSLILLDGIRYYRNNERTYVNYYVVSALRARVALYEKDWKHAEILSSNVIAETSTYEILDNPELVFKANSREAIWQLSPRGRDTQSSSTFEGFMYVMIPMYPSFTAIILSEDFAESFEVSDRRKTNWIGYNEDVNMYFIHKYKIKNSLGDTIEEYSMVLRLAEQYLIRAEARARQGKLLESVKDINTLRLRAGLPLISATHPEISMSEILKIIAQERAKELFGEWGQRWFDLKRTGKITEVMKPLKTLWQDSAILFPIPENERLKNPNLDQNNGY